MTPAEKETCLKVLSVVAWADGTVSDVEREGLAEFIAAVGEFPIDTVRSTLDSVKTLDDGLLGAVRVLPPSTLAMLISFAHELIRAAQGDRATPREMAVLRRVAGASLGDDRWDEVLEWLAAQQRADVLYDALFEEDEDDDASDEAPAPAGSGAGSGAGEG
jgi:hypothetical protein